MKSIILGTRGSALALAQTDMVERALRAVFPELEIERKVIKTTGDSRTDIPLSEVARAADLDKACSPRSWKWPWRVVRSISRCIV